MNIESMLEKIDLFDELVIRSGVQRDITDYRQSLNQAQNQNLVFMKELSKKLQDTFVVFDQNSLDNELKIILKDTEPFTELATLQDLEDIDNDAEVTANIYVQEFAKILDRLILLIDSNKKELDSVKEMLSKYVVTPLRDEALGEQALVSLIFKDLKSTGNIKEFSKALKRWDRTLFIYQHLLKSDSPEEVSLVGIQNGSIDVIFNIDFDIAVDLADLFGVGLKAYGAYLLYKSETARELISSYMGNKKLIAMETERDALMLENIKLAIEAKISEQHATRLKTDKSIDKTAIKKKVEEVGSIITDHIIKGNEVKLLTVIKEDVEDEDESEDESEEYQVATELRQEMSVVRERFKKLDAKDKQKLLQRYALKDEEE